MKNSGVEALADALKEHGNLKTLKLYSTISSSSIVILRDNSITNLMPLADLLKANNTLTHLDMGGL